MDLDSAVSSVLMIKLEFAAVALVGDEEQDILGVEEDCFGEGVIIIFVMSEVEFGIEVVEDGAESELTEQRLIVFRCQCVLRLLLLHRFLFPSVHVEDVQCPAVSDTRQPIVVEAKRQRKDIHFVAASPHLLQSVPCLRVEQPDQCSLSHAILRARSTSLVSSR